MSLLEIVHLRKERQRGAAMVAVRTLENSDGCMLPGSTDRNAPRARNIRERASRTMRA
jgi:hypothetical protein